LFFRYLWTDRRAAFGWAASYGATSLALLVLPLLTTDWEAIAGPYGVQLGGEPMGPTIYGRVVPEGFAENGALGRGFRFGTLALVMVAMLAPRLPDLTSVLRRGAVAVIIFAGLSVFYAPHWIV